ncbi:MAG: MATE family efflux transporter [Gammaproteobacteria bacterium]|nr:MATE family efflux transporter [Gammaproteobacteria bacterium]
MRAKTVSKIFKKIPPHFYVASTGWASRFISGIAQVVSISILLKYLGTDLYAAFAVIIGLQYWFMLSDLGLGASLQNYLSECFARGENPKQLLSTAAIMVYCLLLCGTLIFPLFSPVLQHFLLRKVSPDFATGNYYLLITIGVIYIATNVFNISYRVLFACKKGYWAYIYQGLSYFFALVGIVIVKFWSLSGDHLLDMLLAWMLPPLLFAVIAFIQCFPFTDVLANFEKNIVKKIAIRSFKFWGFTLAATFAIYSDYLVISQTLNTHDIAIYNILAKCFNFMFFVYMALLTAVWPELAELFVKKDVKKANSLLYKTIVVGAVLTISSSLIFLIGKNFFMAILAAKSGLILPVSAIILFGEYYLIRVWVDAFSVGLQSQNTLRVMLISSCMQALISVTGMYIFSRAYGLNGIICGMSLALLVTSAWILPLVYYRKKVE